MVKRMVTSAWKKNIFLFLLLAACVLSMGARPACRPPPNLDCTDFSLTVEPGTCEDIGNPCSTDGSWAEVDHFRLYQEPDGLFIRGREGAGGTVARDICAADTVAPMVDEEVSFLYTKVNRRRRPDYGEGFVYITTVNTSMEAAASATPANIMLGGSSQLDVVVSRGTAPYTYLWMSDPPGEIDPGDVSLQNPVVSPEVDTEYTIAVTDSAGDVATDIVWVSVGMGLAVSAVPDTINVGESSQLEALVTGGGGDYTYDWVPLATLDDSTIPDPTATPPTSQLYQVTVRDQFSGVAIDTVSVRVNMELEVTATPAIIDEGDSSQLNVTVSGGAPPYTFNWEPADTLDNPMLEDPLATPAVTTMYEVTVTDADNLTEEGSVQVAVNPAAALTACFTVTLDSPTPGGIRDVWDAGCSTGADLEYRWEFSVLEEPSMDMCFGEFGDPDGYENTPCSDFTFSEQLQVMNFDMEGQAGHTHRTTLYIKDSAGNVASVSQDYSL